MSVLCTQHTIAAASVGRTNAIWANLENLETFQYLEIEVSPRGRYLLLLLDGERNTLLQALPVFPDGVTDLSTLKSPHITNQ